MVNDKLLKVATPEKFIALGLIEEHDGTGDPRGTSWNIRNAKYHLWVDAWCEVQLARRNPDTDFITLHITDLSELRSVVDWISDEDDEKIYKCVGCEKSISANEASKIYFCHCTRCEKTKNKIAELEAERQVLLSKYKNLPEGEDTDHLASEIVNYKMIIMELEKTITK